VEGDSTTGGVVGECTLGDSLDRGCST
jgi:hypothetical protein